MDESAFFSTHSFVQGSLESAPELIHSSESGWSELYRIDRDGRFKVLKALKQQYRGDFRYETLLRKEYEIGYRLSHPNLCEVYSFHEVAGLGHCIEMEWINGITLDVFISGRTLTRELSSSIIAQLCDALSYCHSCQIIHRDIKPENIMITHSGCSVKLIDFGLSDSDSHSIFKSACGTASFAAPELFDGSQPDILSDIFSLGKVIALLHHSFSGIAARCTRVDPSRRYPDVESVKAAAASVRKTGGMAYVLAVAGIIALAIFIFLQSYPREEPARELPDIRTTVTDSTPSTPAPPRAPVRESKPANPSRKSTEYDADDIDELFRIATELVDKGD